MLFYVVALICENNYNCAKEFIGQKQILSMIANYMQVSEERDRDGDNYKKRLLKGAGFLVASLSSVRKSSSD